MGDPRDVNEQAVADWVEESTPYERVRAVMRRTYEVQTVDEIAERAYVDSSVAREHLRVLASEGYVAESSEADRDETLYKRSGDSLAEENELINEMAGVDDIVYRDGEARCPYDDCDWWVPRGMEYAYLEHVEEHEDDKF